jgi:hypothetical protein
MMEQMDRSVGFQDYVSSELGLLHDRLNSGNVKADRGFQLVSKDMDEFRLTLREIGRLSSGGGGSDHDHSEFISLIDDIAATADHNAGAIQTSNLVVGGHDTRLQILETSVVDNGSLATTNNTSILSLSEKIADANTYAAGLQSQLTSQNLAISANDVLSSNNEIAIGSWEAALQTFTATNNSAIEAINGEIQTNAAAIVVHDSLISILQNTSLTIANGVAVNLASVEALNDEVANLGGGGETKLDPETSYVTQSLDFTNESMTVGLMKALHGDAGGTNKCWGSTRTFIAAEEVISGRAVSFAIPEGGVSSGADATSVIRVKHCQNRSGSETTGENCPVGVSQNNANAGEPVIVCVIGITSISVEQTNNGVKPGSQVMASDSDSGRAQIMTSGGPNEGRLGVMISSDNITGALAGNYDGSNKCMALIHLGGGTYYQPY